MSVGVAGGRPRPDETETLIRVWEAAVRSTHAFLTEAGIAFYREVVREALPKIDLHVRRDAQGQPVAFLATADERIEMLFVHSAAQGNGLGWELVQWARQQKGAWWVDVNEQNEVGRRFYARLGFRVTGRSATDDYGRPFPILHLTID